jgi:hypothetical protein
MCNWKLFKGNEKALGKANWWEADISLRETIKSSM